jgi:hypothetical protein
MLNDKTRMDKIRKQNKHGRAVKAKLSGNSPEEGNNATHSCGNVCTW